MPLIALWLIASAVAMFMAMSYETAALVDGTYIPAGNDSFYHARRIIDAAIGERGFYQFDDMIHVPDGSWLNWPWGYDYVLATALSLTLLVAPGMEPMAFLAHVPVAWLVVNTGLLALICRKAGLSLAFTAVVLLGFSLLPLTQSLHGTGVIDHHFIELTFVLGTVLAGLGFFSHQAAGKDAILLGVVLGLAPAFHNGLFILQIPVLVVVALSWLGNRLPDASLVKLLAAALGAASLVAVLPTAARPAIRVLDAVLVSSVCCRLLDRLPALFRVTFLHPDESRHLCGRCHRDDRADLRKTDAGHRVSLR